MRRYSTCFALLLLAVAPATVSEAIPHQSLSAVRRAPAERPSLREFKRRLADEGRDPAGHGLYIEALDDGAPIAAFNEDRTFNPASVVKLATTLAALDALGPEHRFRTEFRAGGEVDPHTGVLAGDLILLSGGDPSFSIPDAREVGEALRRIGVRRITGNLVIAGAFNCNYNTQTDVSAGVFRRQSRLAIGGATRFEDRSAADLQTAPRGRLLLTVESEPLLHILRYQNAHSLNACAELLATHIGGGEGVGRFLIDRLGLPESEVLVSRASGLDINRLTARGTVRLLRELVAWTTGRGIRLEEIMPVAAIDASTLSDRFTGDRFAGSIIAKTGTLHDTDGGVAALAGLAYTARGALLFAVYDMAEGHRVEHLRQVQDAFLRNLIEELGGPVPRVTDPARRELPAPTGRFIAGPPLPSSSTPRTVQRAD